MKLKEHINQAHGGSQKHFAASEGFSEAQVSRWIKYGCIWFEGAVYKQQSKPVAEGTLNASIIFTDTLEMPIKLALVGRQLLMRMPSKCGEKSLIVEVSEGVAKALANREMDSTLLRQEPYAPRITYDEFIAEYKIDSVVPYNAKDAF